LRTQKKPATRSKIRPARCSPSFFIAHLPMEIRVGNKYKLGRKIGAGSFGEIYLGMITSLSHHPVH
jgi:hypothetical protein